MTKVGPFGLLPMMLLGGVIAIALLAFLFGFLLLLIHVDNPTESTIFKSFPQVLADTDLTGFICDYCRLIIIGNARPHEIEALMDEEIHTAIQDKLKPYHALTSIGDGLPAIGIIAAVLGVIKAMGALDKAPEVLGHLIGAALVGTFAGIFFSYGVVYPVAQKIKITREYCP